VVDPVVRGMRRLEESRADPNRRGGKRIGPESNTGKIRRRRPRRIGQVAYFRSTRPLGKPMKGAPLQPHS
jgi:hypothetical protein